MRSLRVLSLLLAVCIACPLVSAQVRTVGQIVGVVEDPTGAVVPGAKVVLTDVGTGFTKETNSAEDGKFIFPDLQHGIYSITVTAPGFRTSVHRNLKVDAGLTAHVVAKLELGQQAETITVEAGTEVLQTSSPTVENVVLGRELRSLPLNNRDALDFVATLPGANQAGSARQSTFLGLPKGAINITIDGLNVQDNLLKSSFGGGMFTLMRPKLDAVEEISVRSAAGTADAAGEGAVQISFVTRRGTNDYHGSAFWQWRHEQFAANSWIRGANNQPRNINRLHTYGFTLGGPFIKDKLFFFFSYEDFRLPEQRSRENQVLTPLAQTGVFSYRPGTTQGPAPNAYTTCDSGTAPNQICQTNLLALAAANGLPSAIDPLVQSMFAVINPIVSGQTSSIDLFRDRYAFAAIGNQRRWFPTLRLDWNITDKLRWQGVANFNRFVSTPDTLNSMDPSFPGTGFIGGQFSNRMSLTTGLNWDITPNISYEMRIGRQSSVVQFFPETEPGTGLPNDLLALYNRGFRLVWPLSLTSLHVRPGTSATTRSLPSSRTVPVLQWGNNVYWQKGKHGMNFGTNLTVITHWDGSFGFAGIPTISLGIGSLDPAFNVITGANLPGMSSSDQTNARNLYALLTGRVSLVNGSTNVDEITKTFNTLAPLTQRNRQNEFGVYVTDQWRLIPSLTVTAGLRWEYQGAPFNRNAIYTSPSFEDIWGQSGVGNIFMPGTLTGNPNPVVDLRARDIYKGQLNNWAPNLGLAWTPKNETAWYKWIFGGSGKSVFRAGYGIAYTREGFAHFTSFAGGNPGLRQSNVASGGVDFCTATLACLNLASVNLAGGVPTLRNDPTTFSFPVPMSKFTFSSDLLTIDSNIKVPYVQSWNVSWQREITPTTVVEVRYVGNHGTRLWRSFDLNEINIFENGFLNEFILAQENLTLNIAGGCGTRFDPVPGCSTNALPIFSAAFSGLALSAGFGNASFRQDLSRGEAAQSAIRLAGSPTFLCRLVGNALGACVAAGFTTPGPYPANLFQANPDLAGVTAGGGGVNAWLLTNGADSTYHSLTVEVRRRLFRGLLVNGHYTFAKGLSSRFDDSATSTNTLTTMRDPGFDKGLSPYDITHTSRVRFIYELPFGPGRRWSSANSVVSRFIEGWEVSGVFAMQTGRPFLLTSGRFTFNQNDPGVITSLSTQQLQDLVKIVKEPGNKFAFFFDPSAIGSDGRACGATAGNCATPILELPTTPGQLGRRIFLKGPNFFKPDISLVKKTSITEQVKLNFRADFFNFVNRTNWLVGGPGAVADRVSIQSTSFGQTTNFFNDLGNQDQGPRMIQFTFRVEF